MMRRTSDPPIAPLPPPSATLRALVQQARPVALRSRWRLIVIAWVSGVAVASIASLLLGVRADVSQLTPAWFWLGAALRGFAFVVATGAALIPRAGSVFPDGDHVRNASILVPLVGAVGDLFVSRHLLIDDSFSSRVGHDLRAALGCATTATLVMGSTCLVALTSLRRAAIPANPGWVGGALGAGLGSLAALVLHLVCDREGVVHLALVHSGAVWVGAIVGATVARRTSAHLA